MDFTIVLSLFTVAAALLVILAARTARRRRGSDTPMPRGALVAVAVSLAMAIGLVGVLIARQSHG